MTAWQTEFSSCVTDPLSPISCPVVVQVIWMTRDSPGCAGDFQVLRLTLTMVTELCVADS